MGFVTLEADIGTHIKPNNEKLELWRSVYMKKALIVYVTGYGATK
jgi:hypothetical protein